MASVILVSEGRSPVNDNIELHISRDAISLVLLFEAVGVVGVLLVAVVVVVVVVVVVKGWDVFVLFLLLACIVGVGGGGEVGFISVLRLKYFNMSSIIEVSPFLRTWGRERVEERREKKKKK